jgi:hypothetical protein
MLFAAADSDAPQIDSSRDAEIRDFQIIALGVLGRRRRIRGFTEEETVCRLYIAVHNAPSVQSGYPLKQVSIPAPQSALGETSAAARAPRTHRREHITAICPLKDHVKSIARTIPHDVCGHLIASRARNNRCWRELAKKGTEYPHHVRVLDIHAGLVHHVRGAPELWRQTSFQRNEGSVGPKTRAVHGACRRDCHARQNLELGARHARHGVLAVFHDHVHACNGESNEITRTLAALKCRHIQLFINARHRHNKIHNCRLRWLYGTAGDRKLSFALDSFLPDIVALLATSPPQQIPELFSID